MLGCKFVMVDFSAVSGVDFFVRMLFAGVIVPVPLPIASVIVSVPWCLSCLWWSSLRLRCLSFLALLRFLICSELLCAFHVCTFRFSVVMFVRVVVRDFGLRFHSFAWK